MSVGTPHSLHQYGLGVASSWCLLPITGWQEVVNTYLETFIAIQDVSCIDTWAMVDWASINLPLYQFEKPWCRHSKHLWPAHQLPASWTKLGSPFVASHVTTPLYGLADYIYTHINIFMHICPCMWLHAYKPNSSLPRTLTWLAPVVAMLLSILGVVASSSGRAVLAKKERPSQGSRWM